MKFCSKCRLEKPVGDFDFRMAGIGKRQSQCRECRRSVIKKHDADRYTKHKEIINKIKLERGCIDCGFKGHPSALHFDHRDPDFKKFPIASGLRRNLDSIFEEISKCDVRCANCHSIRTTTDGQHASRPRLSHRILSTAGVSGSITPS